MKTIKSYGLVLCLFIIGGGSLKAQDIVYFDLNYVVAQMPETKNAEEALKKFQDQLQMEITRKEDEIKKKYKIYEELAKNPDTPPAVLQEKEKEIIELEQALQQFVQEADKQFQEKRAEMLQPIYEKVETALQDISKEKNYALVLRSEALLYQQRDRNISDMVLLKMGITPQPLENK